MKYIFDYLPKEEVLNLLSIHRKDKLLFEADFLKGLKLAKDLEEKIFFHNVSEILKFN